jgi:hypothetical protein
MTVDVTAHRFGRHRTQTSGRYIWIIHLWLLGLTAALWVVSIRAVRLNDMAGLGLLNALPVTYYQAIAVVTLGFIFATVQERLSPAMLWVYILALILLLHGTTPWLYDEPRYSWTYKHLGVIKVIAATGSVDRSVDIYMNWPGFFALNAWFSRVTGVSAVRYAEWSQVFLELANVLALRFAMRGLTTDDRTISRATWLFLLGNWVGQNYLAPQAAGFLLSLVVIGLCLRRESSEPRGSLARRWRDRLDALGARVGGGAVERCPPEAVIPARVALVAGVVCYVAVVISHQLSPVMAIAAASAIWLLTRRVPGWIPLGMIAIELAWVALSWAYLGGRFSLLSFNPFALPGGHYARSEGLPGFVWVTRASLALSVVVSALAVIGLVRRLRAGHWDLAGIGLVAAATVIVLGQDYGGEIMLRVYLFGLPWLAFFGAAALSPARPARLFSVRSQWRLALATALLSPLLLVSYFGLETQNRIDRDDVAISVWYEQHAPRGSLLLFLTPNVPNRLTDRYPRLLIPGEDYNPNLADDPGFRKNGIGPEDVPVIERYIRQNRATHAYLVISPAEERYVRLYGMARGGTLAPFERRLGDEQPFHLVKTIGRARLYAYRPPASAAALRSSSTSTSRKP